MFPKQIFHVGKLKSLPIFWPIVYMYKVILKHAQIITVCRAWFTMQRGQQCSSALSEDLDLYFMLFWYTSSRCNSADISLPATLLWTWKPSIMNDSGGEQSPSLFSLNWIINRSDSSSETNKHSSFWICGKAFIRRCAVLHSRSKQKMGL